MQTRHVLEQMNLVTSNATQQQQATDEIAQHIELVVLGAKDNAHIALQAERLANHLKNLTE
jgi:methyl-accepting chemotaxis protein